MVNDNHPNWQDDIDEAKLLTETNAAMESVLSMIGKHLKIEPGNVPGLLDAIGAQTAKVSELREWQKTNRSAIARASNAEAEVERLENLMRDIQAAMLDIEVVDITDRALCPDTVSGSPTPEVCEWLEDDDGWHGSCGKDWEFFDDGPDENGMKFCMKCGKQVAVVEWANPPDQGVPHNTYVPDPDDSSQEIDYCWTHGNNFEGTTGGIYPKDECPDCAAEDSRGT